MNTCADCKYHECKNNCVKNKKCLIGAKKYIKKKKINSLKRNVPRKILMLQMKNQWQGVLNLFLRKKDV